MREPTIDTLRQRLDRLERENCRLKRGAVVVLVVLVGVVLMGQAGGPKRRIVEAEMFVLRDTEGRVRAILGAEPPSGKAPTQPMLWPVSSDLEYGLHVYGTDGRPRASLTEWQGGSGGYLSLRDKDTASKASLLVASGLASLDLRALKRGHAEEERVQRERATKFKTSRDPEERRKAMREDGHSLSVAAYSDGPRISLTDERGESRAVLGRTVLLMMATGSEEHRPPSSLVLFDKDGKVIWKAP